jgi:hypothetical protein
MRRLLGDSAKVAWTVLDESGEVTEQRSMFEGAERSMSEGAERSVFGQERSMPIEEALEFWDGANSPSASQAQHSVRT